MQRVFGVAVLGVAAIAFAAEQTANLTTRYAAPAQRLIRAALADSEGLAKLEHLTTRIGNRISGSAALAQATQWMEAELRREGFDNVHLQPVMVQHWVRGREAATVAASGQTKPMAILGLGGTVATPDSGVEASVVIVHSFDELNRLGRAGVEGKIVLFNQPWQGLDRAGRLSTDDRDRYAATGQYRSRGPSLAAHYGAVAMLLRSLTGASLYTPHTGNLNYDPAEPRIPAAAVTVEDAEWMERRALSGDPIRVRLELIGHHVEGEAPSANVLGELRGAVNPEEVVVIGGHIDSWDVGQGAHDDGAGVVAAWQAVALIKQLGLKPRRTIRIVAWTNEESGVRGSRAYRASLSATDIARHAAAIEMDMGAEAPLGLDIGLATAAGDRKASEPIYQRALRRASQITALLKPINATRTFAVNDETDIGPLVAAGVPGIGLHTVRRHYFDWHHTEADTFDKINPTDFRKCVASLAVTAYVLADMPGRLGE